MNKTNILHVITGTTAALGIELENGDATAQRIIDNISDPRNGVQLAYLQVYLDKLFRSAGGVAPVAFTDALIDATGALGDVMAEFLEEQTRSIQADVHANFPDIDKDAVQRIIEEFATLEGTKAPLTRAELAARLPAFDKIIDGVLTALQNARLFRNVDGRLELAHDSLALRVADQRSADSKAALKIEKIVRDRMSGFEQTGTWLNAEETTLVRSTFATLRLSPAERDFYTGSVEKVAEAAAAEESRRQAELARERALSAANARAAQIAKQRTRWVAGAALIMFILMLLAGYAQIKANRAERQKAQTISAAIKNADGVVQFINLNVAGLANENALREEILRRAILLQLSLFNGRVPGDNLSYAQLLQSYARLMYDTRQTSRAKKMAMPLVIQARANLRQNPDNEDWKIVEASMQFILLDSMQGLRERKAAAIRALENDKTALGYANVAELEIQLGEYESARRNLEMAQTLMPKDYLAELFVGYQWSRLYVALGDLDNARKSLRETRDSADKVTTLADKDFQYYQLATYCLIGEIFLPDTTGEGISSLEKAKNLNTYLIKKYHPSVDIEKSILKCRVKLESM